MRPLAIAVACGIVVVAQSPVPDEATPHTLDDFRAAAARVLAEAGVPGAGIALVRADAVEWEGGIGFADRDRRTPVTADTHFRAGSISKTFVAIALVQLYYSGALDLNAVVDTIAPDVPIENPWRETDPVRVIHLLEHTAGFDDMHMNEIYNVAHAPDIPLLQVLKLNPHSRRVRWRPGTRMSYSNPGYALAGYIIEKVSGQPYEDYIARQIFKPLGMNTSSFRLTAEDEKLLAQGYADATGAPTGFPPIYLRPAGNLHSSAHELARFVRMLLQWGETEEELVVDPEYLSNMERSTTTLAASAGLRNTYGSGIAWNFKLPYPVLGHGGGIEGFTSVYGYSPSRDVGYVILLNTSAQSAGRALDRLSALAIRYLKRDVDTLVKPGARVPPAVTREYEGYYHDAGARHQLFWPAQWLLSGRTVVSDGEYLLIRPVIGPRQRLIAVSDTLFRREDDVDATLVFTRDANGTMVLSGGQLYAERTPRWRVERVRLPVLAAVAILLSPALVAIAWLVRVRRARPRGFWDLKIALMLCPVLLIVPLWALTRTPLRERGLPNAATGLVLVATLAWPALPFLIAILARAARRGSASSRLVTYAWVVAFAATTFAAYLAANGLIGLRLWTY
jgi:CubicO group peptidase (beta-lactamase class C family)